MNSPAALDKFLLGKIEADFGDVKMTISSLAAIYSAYVQKHKAEQELKELKTRIAAKTAKPRPKAAAPSAAMGPSMTVTELCEKYFRDYPTLIVRKYLTAIGHPKSGKAANSRFQVDGLEEAAYCFFADSKEVRHTRKYRIMEHPDLGYYRISRTLSIGDPESEKKDIETPWKDKAKRIKI